ncbi:haloacid dehalogenase-like hydrolase [Peptococcus simiae]|uniref:Haloacid dehalogenase-like hydrolase n=1 Tax=Peptococcus simiae TaxID=1643805 RepID=A0ABW9GY99_9FIRM
MRVYDFDETIYDGDSTAHFFFFLLRRHPGLVRFLPEGGLAFLRYKFGSWTKTQFKERLYRLFQGVEDIEAEVAAFWAAHRTGIKDFYLAQQAADDLVISASPRFLLAPICADLGIHHLLASEVDPQTGFYRGLNCWGDEKVRRYLEAGYRLENMTDFYSDSFSDVPLAVRAKRAWLVTGMDIQPWPGHPMEA